MKWLALIGLLILAACAPQPATTHVPTLPAIPYEDAQQAAPTEDVPAAEKLPHGGTQAQPASAIRDLLFATRYDGSKAMTAADVVCDREHQQLAFRFRNLETRSWQLDNDVPLNPPEGLVGVYVMVNNYHANDRAPKMLDGVRLFGPKDKFSENCGGVEVLHPGEQAVCVLAPVPLRDVYRAGGVNEIIVNVPGSAEDPRVEFTC